MTYYTDAEKYLLVNYKHTLVALAQPCHAIEANSHISPHTFTSLCIIDAAIWTALHPPVNMLISII